MHSKINAYLIKPNHLALPIKKQKRYDLIYKVAL